MRKRKRKVVKNQDLQHIFDDVVVCRQLCENRMAAEDEVSALMKKHGAWENSDMLLSLIRYAPPGYFRFRLWSAYYDLCPEEKGKNISKEERFGKIPTNGYKKLETAYGYLHQMTTWSSLICYLSKTIVAALKDKGFYDDENTLIDVYNEILPYGCELSADISDHLNAMRFADWEASGKPQNE